VLVTLTVISLLRFLLALSPRLALHYPVRKWAVASGFVSATFYLFLSGAEVATQRSYLMIAIMLLAMLIDRRAMTMRNVALAALLILLVTPEAVLEPGFQMSFAAAGALVSAYGALARFRQDRLGRRESTGPRFGHAGTVAAYAGGLIFTSLVAGLATGLFAAWHFHRIAPMGLVANLIASPIISVVMMPAALGSVLLMPYGLEKLALVPMGYSVDAVVAISDWVNQFPVLEATGMQPLALLASGGTGFLILMLLNTRLRLAGLLPVAAMALFAGSARPPDLIISQSGKAVGMADANGQLALLYDKRDRFIADIWKRAWPHGGVGDAASLKKACDKDHCIAVSPGGVRVELVYKPDLLDGACESADILVAPRLRFVDCDGRKPGLILKRDDFDAKGVHVVRFNGKRSFMVETGIEPDNRPWNIARRPPPYVYKAKTPPQPVSSGESDLPDGLGPSPGPD
jgi:competence protein ComEC